MPSNLASLIPVMAYTLSVLSLGSGNHPEISQQPIVFHLRGSSPGSKYSMPNGPMAVTWMVCLADLPVKSGCIAGQNDDATGRIRLRFIAVELIAQANVENAGHDRVDPVLRVSVRHQLHA